MPPNALVVSGSSTVGTLGHFDFPSEWTCSYTNDGTFVVGSTCNYTGLDDPGVLSLGLYVSATSSASGFLVNSSASSSPFEVSNGVSYGDWLVVNMCIVFVLALFAVGFFMSLMRKR
jgi:hypothetical protein